jgi:hypothetical protein
MIVIAVICGLIFVGLATAGWYDYRARRRRRHFNLTNTEALQSRLDVGVRANLSFPAGQNWINRSRRR